MDFPAYVPAAVRAHITTLIEGNSPEPTGWAAALASAELRLAEIERAIKGQTRRGEVEHLDSLRKERAKTAEHRDRLAGNLDCLRRLAHDGRMRNAFALLTREFTDDKQWRDFIYAAWAARVDFSKYRERLKRAAELKAKISDAADGLAELIRQFSETGINGPDEFYLIPALLEKTDNHEMYDYNLCMWRAIRPYVLGYPSMHNVPEIERTQKEDDQSTAPVTVIVTRTMLEPGKKPDIDPVEEAQGTWRYGWELAPDFSALLNTLAKAARDFKPSESGVIGAAIASRQRSTKTEYLRAFGNLLTDVHNFTLSTAVMQAMAIVANVVINDQDIDVSYDDVRKALAKRGSEPLENSGEK